MSLVWRRAVLLLRSSLIQNPAVNVLRTLSRDVPISLDYHSSDVDHLNTLATVKKMDALTTADEQEIMDVAPELRPTFNLAAYVNKSNTLQEMVRLGVDLTRWEKRKDMCSYILKLNFDEDIKQHIIFLHNIGVAADGLGQWLSINPLIFKESLDDLQTRYNYLLSKKFDESQISRIVSRNPNWLLFSTTDIDERLGFFQRTFKLSNNEVRHLTCKGPRLITYKMYHIKRMNFAILEEMGFTNTEVKSLLLSKPKLWMAHGVSLMRRFDYAHNEMGLTHSQIIEFPKILSSRDFRVKQRHGFLKLIGRDQYDRLKPNYVSPDALIVGDDVEFCTDVAKTTIIDFNNFLKTL